MKEILKDKKKLILIGVGVLGFILIMLGTIMYFNQTNEVTEHNSENEIQLIKNFNTTPPVAANQFLRIAHDDVGDYLRRIGFDQTREIEISYQDNDVTAWEARTTPYGDLPAWDHITVIVQDNQAENISITLSFIQDDADFDVMYQELYNLNRMFNGFTIDKDKMKASYEEANEAFANAEELPYGIASGWNEFQIGSVGFSVGVTITETLDQLKIYEFQLMQFLI